MEAGGFSSSHPLLSGPSMSATSTVFKFKFSSFTHSSILLLTAMPRNMCHCGICVSSKAGTLKAETTS